MKNQVYEKPRLSFSEALTEAKEKLTQFTGRSRRSEFWWCYLAYLLVSMFLGWIPFIGSLITTLAALAMIPLTFRRLHDTGHSGWWWGAGSIASIIGVIIIICQMVPLFMELADDPSLMDDDEFVIELFINMFKSPVTWIMLGLGLIYEIVMLVFFCLDSDPNANKYGESPKYVEQMQ